MKVILALLAVSTANGFTPSSSMPKQTTALNNIGSKWAYDPFGGIYQDNHYYRGTDPNNSSGLNNNVGSKWAYDPFGGIYQDNHYYRGDLTTTSSDRWAHEMWYFQPWSYIEQPQFFPLPRMGIDMWYYEPRSVVPPDDEFFHGYNSASHMWIPKGTRTSTSAPAPAAAAPQPALKSSEEQGSVPPSTQQQQEQQQQQNHHQQQQQQEHQQRGPPMPELQQQKMPQMDNTMSAYDRAMAGGN